MTFQTFLLFALGVVLAMLIGLLLLRRKTRQDGVNELLEWDDAAVPLAQAGFTQLDVDTWTKTTDLIVEPIGVKLRREHNQVYAWVEARWPGCQLERFLRQSARATVGERTPAQVESGEIVPIQISAAQLAAGDVGAIETTAAQKGAGEVAAPPIMRTPLDQWVARSMAALLTELPGGAAVSVKAPDRTGDAFEIIVEVAFKSTSIVLDATRVVEELLRVAVRS